MAFSITETAETTETVMTGTAGDLAAAGVIAAGGPWPDGGAGENDTVTVKFKDATSGAVLFEYDQGAFDMTVEITTADEEPV